MFLWAVMVFGFSAGELFLLVDEKKIKRRFISPAEAFLRIWMRVLVHADPCVGHWERNAWLMCFLSLARTCFLTAFICCQNLACAFTQVRWKFFQAS